MARMNPVAIAFWGVTAVIGYFVAGTDGAIAGAGIGMGISVILSCKG